MTGWLRDFMSGPATYIGFGDTIKVSLGNLIVILGMVALFALAVLVPFPGTKDGSKDDK